jgi:uncharacterized protein with von Willebrand factor type A (vWA) domain
MKPESTARNLADRLDALAAALREAGVPPERSARLLATAAGATMDAVTLDALLAARESAAVDPPATPLRLAA